MTKILHRSLLYLAISAAFITFGSSCSNSNDYEIFGSIHGIVTDYSNGQPLENVSVVLSPSGVTKQTDASGHYQFNNLDTQQYTLTYQKQGYQANRKTISTISGESQQVDVQLKRIPE